MTSVVRKVYDPTTVLAAAADMHAQHPDVVQIVVCGGHEHGGEKAGGEPFTCVLLLGLNYIDVAL